MAERNLGPVSRFEDRGRENQGKLAALDAMSRYDVRNKVADERAAKDAFDQQFKLSEQQRKINSTEERIGIAKERNDLTERQRVVSEQLAEMRQKESEVKMAEAQASMALMQHKLDSTKAVAEQTTGMFTDMGKMRDAKGFISPADIAKLRASYPDAAMHANNAQALDHEVKRYDDYQTLQAKVVKDPSLGEKTIKTKDANGNTTTLRVPLKPGEADAATAAGERAALQTKHDDLAAKMMKDKSFLAGTPTAEDVDALNAVKAKLGYNLLDSKGQPIAGQTPPVAAPAAQVAATTQDGAPHSEADSPSSHTPVAAPDQKSNPIPDGSRYLKDKTTGDIHVVGPDGTHLGILSNGPTASQ